MKQYFQGKNCSSEECFLSFYILQVDKELATGEYFLKPSTKKAKIQAEKKVSHFYVIKLYQKMFFQIQFNEHNS